MVVGNSSSDEAKIGGITPEVLSLSGRCEDWPSNILLPTWRFGYWISSRRCARSMNTMKAITATAMMMTIRISPVDMPPVRPSSSMLASADGNSATMPDRMISEMPLPMPREVICSPSHIRNMVPPVSVIAVDVAGALEAHGDAVGLERGEQHREIAGVLVQRLAAGLAFLLQGFELRRDGGQELN